MKAVLFSLLFLAGYIVSAQQIFTTKEGAINGYDAVAYFTEAKPVREMLNIVLPGKMPPGISLLKRTSVFLKTIRSNMHRSMVVTVLTELHAAIRQLHNPRPGARLMVNYI
jgi:hypothetical protein